MNQRLTVEIDGIAESCACNEVAVLARNVAARIPVITQARDDGYIGVGQGEFVLNI